MPLALDVDPRILPFIHNNDPLPSKLKPVLDAHLGTLRNRVPACDALIGEIEEGIAGCQHKMREMEKQIEDLQMQLRRQMEARDELNASMQVLASTTSVVRRLPPEIVASIISFSVLEGWADFNERYLCNACAVSRLWRNTALSTPSLWRFLEISLYRFSKGRSIYEARLHFSNTLDLWFSRGGEGAEVSLWLQPGGRHRGGLAVRDVIDWVLTSRFKFGSLKLEFNPIYFPEFQSLLSTNTPSLHQMQDISFHLPEVPSPASQVVVLPTIDVGSTLPKLDALRFSGDTGPKILPAVFSHPSITKLEIAAVTLRPFELSAVLRVLPSLQSLELSYCAIQTVGGATRTQVASPVVHRCLREFILYDGIFNYFDGLSCPALERFDLDSDTYNGLTSAPEELDDHCAHALGSLLHGSKTPNLSLHLGAQFPTRFLNGVFKASHSTIKTLRLHSSLSLPLDIGEDGVRLAIPSSVQSIHNPECMSEEESASWNQKLALCLDDPPSQALSVIFGQ
ncbi:hypothetical protein BKA70DRAFT_1279087 [Coprinopsis sp. MPI-PUGE-AT-0042]|nr:hypothetical protein BKA70DRAFT_1279087 [Coprinopsis sp. MPI-PUGE-AT-0042]